MLVALLSITIPVATFIQGTLQKGRELELQRQQQVQQLRLAYANMMVASGVERMAFLADFIAATEEDPLIKRWAVQQQTAIKTQQAELEQRIEEEQKKAFAAERARIDAERKAAEAEKLLAAAQNQAARDQAAREKQEADSAAVEAGLKAATARSNLEVSRTTLKGLPPEQIQNLRIRQYAIPAQQLAVPQSAP